MTSGFASGPTDLDAIFDPYTAGTKPAATGYKVGTQDLADRYNPISEGETASATGLSVQSVGDLNTLFAAIGTSTEALVIPFGNYTADSSGSHDVGSSFGLSIHSDGTWLIGMSALNGGTGGTPTSGAWHQNPATGVGAEYEVRFTAAITIGTTGTATQGTYTASTGWLALSSDQGVSAASGHISSGGSQDVGSSTVSGHWTVDIRKIGGTAIRSSTCAIDVSAIST